MAEEQKSAASKRSPKKVALPVVTQNRLFLLLILIITGALVTSLAGLALLAIFAHQPPTDMQKEFADVCKYISMVSIGALVGLLGGRAATPDRLEIADRP